jgi:hypothetical protein
MPLPQIIAKLKSDIAQCEALIANAHRVDAQGNAIFPQLDREQITIAAFLNMFIAWEEFLEETITEYMMGAQSLGGTTPVKYVTPPSPLAAKAMVIGVMKHFDYANHDFVLKIVKLYFEDGKPFEPILSSMISDLADLRTIRNSCAHISSTTRKALESLALRILGQPQIGIGVYALLTATHPLFTPATVFDAYKGKLVTAAELIVNG